MFKRILITVTVVQAVMGMLAYYCIGDIHGAAITVSGISTLAVVFGVFFFPAADNFGISFFVTDRSLELAFAGAVAFANAITALAVAYAAAHDYGPAIFCVFVAALISALLACAAMKKEASA